MTQVSPTVVDRIPLADLNNQVPWEDPVAEFIFHQNGDLFQVPICYRYLPYEGSQNQKIDKDENKTLMSREAGHCVCGKPQHGEITPLPGKWEIETHCASQSHACFGEMIFGDNVNYENDGVRARYLRLTGAHSEEDYKGAIMKLMTDDKLWAMRKPRLIIEVTGTAQDSDIDNLKVVNEMKAGVVEAALASDAWIVTGGSNSGIMKQIGDEVTKYRRLGKAIPCVGIASWGCVLGRDKLYRNDVEIRQEAAATYQLGISSPDGLFLNPGHNCFLLVDNARQNIYGEEIEFRHELTHYISRNISDKHVPIVMLALGGGIGTWRTFEKCFGMDQGSKEGSLKTPLIIFQGFGGATDLLIEIKDTFFGDTLAEDSKTKMPIDDTRIKSFINDSLFADRVKESILQNADVTIDELIKKMINHLKEESNRKLLTVIKLNTSSTSSGNADVTIDELIKKMINHLKEESNRKLLTVIKLNTSSTSSGNELNEAILQAAALQVLTTTNEAQAMAVNDVAEVQVMAANEAAKAKAMAQAIAAAKAAATALLLALDWNAVDAGRTAMETQLAMLKHKKIGPGKPDSAKKEILTFYKTLSDQLSAGNIVQTCLVSGQHAFLDMLFDKIVLMRGNYLSHQTVKDAFTIALEESDREDASSQAIGFLKLIARSDKNGGSKYDSLGKEIAKNMDIFLENPLVENDTNDDTVIVTCSCHREKITDREKKRPLKPHRNAYILQLLLNHDEMAVEMWCNGNDLIGTALAGSVLLRNMADLARRKDEHSLADQYDKYAAKWEKRAVSVLELCAESQQRKVSWLLSRSLSSWQGRSVFEIAFYGRCLDFVELDIVQAKIRHIWFSRISAFTHPILLYAAPIFPLPFVLPVKLIREDLSNKNEALMERFKEPSSSQPENDQNTPFEQSICSGFNFFKGIFHFYTSTFARFYWNVNFLAVFLLLFSSFVLKGHLNPDGISYLEGAVLIWSFCLVIDITHETYADEASVIYRMKQPKWGKNIKDRYDIFEWPKVDYFNAIIPLIILILMITSLVLRLTLSPENFIFPQSTYAIACLLFWHRSLQIFYAVKPVGIIVVYLAELLPTIIYFLIIYWFLLLAYSIPIYALMVPASYLHDNRDNETEIDKSKYFSQDNYENFRGFVILLVKVVYNRLWNLFQFDFDESRQAVEGVCPNDGEQPITALPYIMTQNGGCKTEFNFVAIVLYIIFIFAVNIAWLNVLIATLSERVSEVRKDARKLSRFNYFAAVRTTYYRCYFPAPISFIELIIRAIVFGVKGRQHEEKKPKKIDFHDYRYNSATHDQLDELERQSTYKVMADEKQKKTNNEQNNATDS